MSGVTFIGLHCDKWLSGTQELSLEERGVLITITALTGATGGAPDYDLSRIARRLGVTKAKAKKLIKSLEDFGKIEIKDGKIFNDRALTELKKAQNFSKTQSKRRQKSSPKNKEKANKNNGEKKPGLNRGSTIIDLEEDRDIGEIDKSIPPIAGEGGEIDFVKSFWAHYPFTHGQNQIACEDLFFDHLSPAEQIECVDKIPAYRKLLERTKQQPVYPYNFIKGKIFQSIEGAPKPKPVLAPDPGTPEWDLFDAVCKMYGTGVWTSWFNPERIRITEGVVKPKNKFTYSKINQQYEQAVISAGLRLEKENAA